MKIKSILTIFLVAFALSTAVFADTNESLRVIISGGFFQVYQKVLPEFERSTGIKVNTGSGASEGVGPKTIRYQLAHGAKADVVILSREGLQKLIEDGRIRQRSEVGLATAPLAAAIRIGSPKPDISTESAFRNALMVAGQISMPGSTSGQFVRDKVFPKLNLPSTVNLTLVARGTESAELLRSGKANLAIGPSSELTNEPGIEVIGMLPANLQLIQTFTAGIVEDSINVASAQKLINYLTNDSAPLLQSISNAGMEPAKRSLK